MQACDSGASAGLVWLTQSDSVAWRVWTRETQEETFDTISFEVPPCSDFPLRLSSSPPSQRLDLAPSMFCCAFSSSHPSSLTCFVVERDDWDSFVEFNHPSMWVTSNAARSFDVVLRSLSDPVTDLWWEVANSNHLREVSILHFLIQSVFS